LTYATHISCEAATSFRSLEIKRVLDVAALRPQEAKESEVRNVILQAMGLKPDVTVAGFRAGRAVQGWGDDRCSEESLGRGRLKGSHVGRREPLGGLPVWSQRILDQPRAEAGAVR
jgi:hypothetical protein